MAHSGFGSEADRVQKALRFEGDGDGGEKKKEEKVGIFDNKERKDFDNVNKKDFQELDLGSPISPLRGTRKSQLGGLTTSTTTTATTSSSSSSSGSVSGRSGRLVTGPGGFYGRRSDSKEHSGELSGSAESSPTGTRSAGSSGLVRAGGVGGGRGSGSFRGDNVRSGGGSGSVRAGGSPGSFRADNVRDGGASGSVRGENVRAGGGSGSVRGGHVLSDSSGSHLLSYSGGVGGGGGASAAVTSPVVNVLPAGNICPSGRVVRTGMMSSRSPKTDVLGSGGVNYGHGSIMGRGVGARAGSVDGGLRGSYGESVNRTRGLEESDDPEELKRLGNEYYLKGNYSEASSLYEKAMSNSPGNSPGLATLHFNRSAALVGLNLLPQALRQCEEAIRLDPGYVKAHWRLGSLYLSLGQVENARRHYSLSKMHFDQTERQKLENVEMHIGKCGDARRIHDWGSTLRETDAAMASGADLSPQLFACRAEALLKLHLLNDASICLSNMPLYPPVTESHSQAKFFGMLGEAYLLVVKAQFELAHGRFDNAITVVEKAAQIDPRSPEVAVLLRNVRMVARARSRGNDLFKSERFTEACSAYGDGLKVDPSNSVLYCNRAACWYKIGVWENSLDDCDRALRLQPNYTKALLRRAASYSKLERWSEALRDYEVLKKELPYDNDIAEQVFHAQVALRKSRGEDVSNMKFGGDVELVLSHEQFRAAVSSPIASVVLFKKASDMQCKQLSQSLDTLCSRYPTMSFLKVDVVETQAIANSENINIVPTVKIYKSGSRLKELVCPSPEVLESSVRHYSM